MSAALNLDPLWDVVGIAPEPAADPASGLCCRRVVVDPEYHGEVGCDWRGRSADPEEAR